MKNLSFVIICLSIITACEPKNNRLPKGKLLSKIIVLNEKVTEGLSFCIEEKRNSQENCIFHFNGKKYLKRVQYVFANNNLKELRVFRPEGFVSYSINELNTDLNLQDLYKVKGQKIKVVPHLGIIDNGDTISDFSIDSENNLVIAEKHFFKNTELSEKECIIYEFN